MMKLSLSSSLCDTSLQMEMGWQLPYSTTFAGCVSCSNYITAAASYLYSYVRAAVDCCSFIQIHRFLWGIENVINVLSMLDIRGPGWSSFISPSRFFTSICRNDKKSSAITNFILPVTADCGEGRTK